MSIPSTLESLSTTAASNGPSGSDQRTLADDGLRQAYAFLAQITQQGGDIASAATITPGSTAWQYDVTGTTGISTIATTNSWAGRLLCLQFDGALILTNSSNLALPGSANITTAAGDVALFLERGSGAWRCINYQRADGSLAPSSIGAATITDLTVTGNTALGNAASADTTTIIGNTTVTTATGGEFAVISQTASDAILRLTATGVRNWNIRANNADTMTIRDDSRGANVVSLSNTGNVTFTAPSSGNTLTLSQASGQNGVVQSQSLGGSQAAWFLQNTSNTASSSARLAVGVGGSSADDPFILFDISGVLGWAIGSDNSDSDSFKVSKNGTLGTNDYLVVTTDGRLYGTALHNNAGAVTGTTNQFIASGTWTPTVTNVLNTDARSGQSSMWTRVGNVVTCSGAITVDPTAGGTTTQVGISLPIASNFTATTDCSGIAERPVGAANFQLGGIQADTTNDRADLTFISGVGDTSNNSVFFQFQYVVL